MQTIGISDFSRVPGGRYRSDGPGNGQQFREEYLVPALKAGSVEVRLDDVRGLPVSFLEEAFGGLIRNGDVTNGELRSLLKIRATVARYERYEDIIWQYIADAAAAKDRAA